MTQVRACFHQLKALAEKMHQDLGVNPSMRAVLEALATDAPRTVPEIAGTKGVSRQHIQTVMNALLDAGLVESQDNPAHKRSPLFALSQQGRSVFAIIREREVEPLRNLANRLSNEVIDDAQRSIANINKAIASELAARNGKDPE